MIKVEKQIFQNSSIRDNGDPRAHPRKPYVQYVFFKYRNQHYKGLVINISRGGVFIETKNNFLFGHTIELAIPSPKNNKNIRINGWIARLCPSGIGVTFERILERRSGKERRSDLDRRNGFDRRDRRRRKAETEIHNSLRPAMRPFQRRRSFVAKTVGAK
jgi:Tfp pilus assembly protein PilZ